MRGGQGAREPSQGGRPQGGDRAEGPVPPTVPAGGTASGHGRFPATIISPGVAFGFARVVEPVSFPAAPSWIGPEDIEAEIARLHRARDLVRQHMQEHVRGVHAPAQEDAAQVLAAHLLVLDDQGFFASIEERIQRHPMPADAAVEEAFAAAAARLAGSEDCYLRSRAEDLRDICASLRRALAYGPDAFTPPEALPGPTVLVVPSLRPSAALRARREGVAAMVADDAAFTSHGAILLRTAGIPALGGIRLADAAIQDGTPLLVNAVDGLLVVQPTDQDLQAARAPAGERLSTADDPAGRPALDALLPGGDSVALFANIDHPTQAALCLTHRLRGVGLFRTEFLVADHATMPDEEDQYRAIRGLVETLRGRPLVVRTFDFGADKEPLGLRHCFGPNPALGLRGIRRHLQRVPDELRTQFRAILRAAAGADVSILLPMVTTVEDVRAARAILTQAKEDLTARGLPFSVSVKLGAMLEVPAAALQVTALLGAVDFLSVGTNDLVQYLTAADRENPAVLGYHSPDDSGIYPLLELVMAAARAAHRERDLSVCGELASDPRAARELVRLGFRTLSIIPQAAAAVRGSLGTMHGGRAPSERPVAAGAHRAAWGAASSPEEDSCPP
jgi:phosphoenolpyruvate-protein phosphotransferase (PTS system enzyme I)